MKSLKLALATLISLSMAFGGVPTTALAEQLQGPEVTEAKSAATQGEAAPEVAVKHEETSAPVAEKPNALESATTEPAEAPAPAPVPAASTTQQHDATAGQADEDEHVETSSPNGDPTPAAEEPTANGENAGGNETQADAQDAQTSDQPAYGDDEAEDATDSASQDAGEDEVAAQAADDEDVEPEADDDTDDDEGEDEGDDEGDEAGNKAELLAPEISSEPVAGPYQLNGVAVWNITVTNPNEDTQTITIAAPGVELEESTITLGAGEQQTIAATHLVTEQDILQKSHSYVPGDVTASIAAAEEGGEAKSASCTLAAASLVLPNPHLGVSTRMTSVPSVMNPPDVSYGVGDTVCYEITVVNDGNVTLHGVRFTTRIDANGAPEIEEDAGGVEGGSSNVPYITFDTMVPGDWRIITVEYPVVSADAGNTVASISTVSAAVPSYSDGTPVSSNSRVSASATTMAIDVREVPEPEPEPEPDPTTDPDTDPTTDPDTDPTPSSPTTIPAPVAPAITPLPATTTYTIPYVTSVVGPAENPIDLPETPSSPTANTTTTTTSVEDDTTPLAGGEDPKDETSWAVVNLVCAALAAILGLVALTGRRRAFGAASLLCGAGAVAAFLLTESMASPMALMDGWTPLMAGLAVCAGILAVLSRSQQN